MIVNDIIMVVKQLLEWHYLQVAKLVDLTVLIIIINDNHHNHHLFRQ